MQVDQKLKKELLPILLIIALGLFLRLIYLYQYASSPVWEMLTVDNNYHHHWAEVLASGELFGGTTYFRAPGYPMVLGVLYFLFGSSLWVGRLLGLFVGLSSIFMTYRLGQSLFDRKTAIVAATLHALYPLCIYFEFELLLDPMFTLLLQVAVYYFLKVLRGDSRFSIVATSGVFFGLAAITRPTALIVAAVAFLFLIWNYRTSMKLVQRTIIFLAGLLICIAPITIRNLVVAGDPVLIASQGGINFYLGNNREADGVSAIMPRPLGRNWRIRQITLIAEKELGFAPKPGDVSSYWTGKATAWIVTHPYDFISLFARKLVYSISDSEISNNRDLLQHFRSFRILGYNPISFGLLIPLSLLTLIICWRNNREVRFLSVMVVAYLSIGAFFFFSSRFRMPILPYLFLLTAYPVYHLKDTKNRRKLLIVSAILISLVAGLISFYPPVTPPVTNAPQYELARSSFYFGQGDYRRALDFARQASLVDRDYTDVNLTIGSCFFRLGMADSALIYYEKELRLHPQRDRTYTNLASLLLTQGQPDAALEVVGKSLEIAPYDIDANLILLRATADQKRVKTTLYDQILIVKERTNNDLQILLEGGILLSNQELLEPALEILQVAVESRRPSIEIDDNAFDYYYRNSPIARSKMIAKAHSQIGFILGKKSVFGESIRHSKLAIKLDSSLADAYVNLISGYIASGQLEKADSVLTLAGNRFPTNRIIQEMITLQR